MTQALL